MKHFLIYSSTGDIVSKGQCSDQDFALQLPLHPGAIGIIEGEANHETQWIDPVSKTIRDRVSFEPIVSGMKISGLPQHTKVVLNDEDTFIIDDGEIDFQTTTPGVYEVAVTPPGSLTKKVFLEVA